MFHLLRPSENRVREFLLGERDSALTYGEVGASRGVLPRGYTVSRTRERLGMGRAGFERAAEALVSWEAMRLGWIEIFSSQPRAREGDTFAILARHCFFWSLQSCRVVYMSNEDGAIRRSSLAYGTLGRHGVRGEERLTVEWHSQDQTVWYEIVSFSRPKHWLVIAASPLLQRLQAKFVRDSILTMKRVVNGLPISGGLHALSG